MDDAIPARRKTRDGREMGTWEGKCWTGDAHAGRSQANGPPDERADVEQDEYSA